MFLITISGLDGSGKSTQIELLKDYLKSQDKTFFYFHAVEFSIGNKVSLPLIRGGRGRGRKDSEEDPLLVSPLSRGRKPESVTKANWLQVQLRKIALLIDIFRFRRLIKKLKVDYIISDRYFYDSVVNINYLETKFPSGLCAEKFIPKPDFAFYIDVKPELIMQRERKPDQGMEYLVAKEKIYSKKINNWKMIVIDGEKDKEEIFDKIKLQVWGETT